MTAVARSPLLARFWAPQEMGCCTLEREELRIQDNLVNGPRQMCLVVSAEELLCGPLLQRHLVK